MTIVKRQTFITTRSDDSTNTLYALVNGVTGHLECNIGIETLPSLDALFELNDMSDGKFIQALKAGGYQI